MPMSLTTMVPGTTDTSIMPAVPVPSLSPKTEVALLTGGVDMPYVFGLAMSLLSQGVRVDLIGSDELQHPAFRTSSNLTFLNLRGASGSGAGLLAKVWRVLAYYVRLLRYASAAKAK